jgi:hypothetical protein
VVVLSLFGLALCIGGLLWVSTAVQATPLGMLVGGLAVFGFGFGLTVTARSTAAVEALGRSAFGLASAGVTVARMLGMGVGLAALTVLGSNKIQSLSVVLTDQAARDAVLPPALQGRLWRTTWWWMHSNRGPPARPRRSSPPCSLSPRP